MSGKRVTIYDVARELGVSASYVSRALNGHPATSQKVRERVRKKATELNYKLNSHAANLRQGSSRIIGVVVPHINQSFFSEAIAGIEEVCFENNHSLVICQSHESFAMECKAVDTLIHQNVDCILISLSAETRSYAHLENILAHHIELIQFDRCADHVDSYKVFNDDLEASYSATKKLFEQGYQRVAFLGGPQHLTVFKRRKEGYLMALRESGFSIPYDFVADDILDKEQAVKIAAGLLSSPHPPDAFLTVSDHQSLGVLEVARSMGIQVPEQLGIFGFANEAFTPIIRPSLSSIDQKSKVLGKATAGIYFDNILKGNEPTLAKREVIIKTELICRESSQRIIHS